MEIAVGNDVLIQGKTYGRERPQVQVHWLSLTTNLLIFSMKREKDVN